MPDENDIPTPAGAGRAVRAAWDKLRETEQAAGFSEDQSGFDRAGVPVSERATASDAVIDAMGSYPVSELGSESGIDADHPADDFAADVGADIATGTDQDIDSDEILDTDQGFETDQSAGFSDIHADVGGEVEPKIPKSEDDEPSDDEYPVANPPL